MGKHMQSKETVSFIHSSAVGQTGVEMDTWSLSETVGFHPFLRSYSASFRPLSAVFTYYWVLLGNFHTFSHLVNNSTKTMFVII